MTFAKLSVVLFLVGCVAEDSHAGPRPAKPPAKDKKMDDDGPPPPPDTAPAEDTTRYVEWMKKKGKPVSQPYERVEMRVGDWGFFDHGPPPGHVGDRTGLDKAGHVVILQDSADWRAFLTAPGLDPKGANQRIAWLAGASAIDPSTTVKMNHKDKVKVPSLVVEGPKVTFQGFTFAGGANEPTRVTITATSSGAKIVMEPASKL